MLPRVPCTQLGGLAISRLDNEQTLDLLAHWMSGDRPRRVATANVDFLQRCRTDSTLRDALTTADLVTADGMPLVWWSRLVGENITERVTGSDMIEPLVARAAREGRRVYFLGGMPGSAKQTAKLLARQNPGLQIAGVSEARVDLNDPDTIGPVVDTIRSRRTDLLFAALGCPKQDLFLQRHLEATGAKVGIGVGASFDFLAGRIPRAPRLLRMTGLEWIFRAATDPVRLGGRYMRNIPYALRMTMSLALQPTIVTEAE